MAATAHPALDKALDSALNAVPLVPRFPLLIGFAVDQRMSSFISLTTALETLIISFRGSDSNAAIERLRAEGRIGRDIDLGHLSPALYGHVNPYGKYRFEIEGRAPSLPALRPGRWRRRGAKASE